MTKEIINKICSPSAPLTSADLTADEKKLLYQTMTDAGATEGFSYNRFFKEGFSAWEIDGINTVKIDFLHHLQTVEKRDDIHISADLEGQYRVYYNIKVGEEQSFDLLVAGDFWRFLGDIQMRKRFGEFMEERGMLSYLTVAKRFSADDWREWEKVGIRQIMEQFYDKINRL